MTTQEKTSYSVSAPKDGMMPGKFIQSLEFVISNLDRSNPNYEQLKAYLEGQVVLAKELTVFSTLKITPDGDGRLIYEWVNEAISNSQ